MTISIFILMSGYRGGHHGEKTASHDGEKKDIHEAGENQLSPGEVCEGQGSSCSQRLQVELADRQGLPSTEDAYQSDSKDGGEEMTDSTSNLPKTGGHVARVLGQLTNDTRVTNLLMLVLVFIGMGGAEAAQTQLCSL